MRLLIYTQSMDSQDPFTGFFVGWVSEFRKHFEQVTVVCLKEGEHGELRSVNVHSLGKEGGQSRLKYISRFFRYAWKLRHEYDAVLVHMNQEYVLLGGLLWKLLGKKIFMWRNHHAGSFLTDVAASMCIKVFCTSTFSYTAKYKKTVIMPVGVDTHLYRPVPEITRAPHSVLFYGRVAPSKRPDMLLEALAEIAQRGANFTASFYGTPLPKDRAYAEGLKRRAHELGLESKVRFLPGQPHSEGPRIFSAYEIFVNLSLSGMYDKMIFEAAACGCIVLAASRDFARAVGQRFTFAENDVSGLADKISSFLALKPAECETAAKELMQFAHRNSLEVLGKRLAEEIK